MGRRLAEAHVPAIPQRINEMPICALWSCRLRYSEASFVRQDDFTPEKIELLQAQIYVVHQGALEARRYEPLVASLELYGPRK